jgi:hypothetical protein
VPRHTCARSTARAPRPRRTPLLRLVDAPHHPVRAFLEVHHDRGEAPVTIRGTVRTDYDLEGAPFRTGVGKPTVPGKSPFVFPSRAQEAEIMRLQAAAFDPHPIEV